MSTNSTFCSSGWSREEDKLFENALAVYGDVDQWESIAAAVPGKTVDEVKQHYFALVDDVIAIEAGLVPLPNYVSSTGNSVSAGIHQTEQAQSGSSSGKRNTQSIGERQRGKPWTEEEHRRFLLGLERYGKGDWRSISRLCVVSKTPTQVASHAQKYYKRLQSANQKKRLSIHDTIIEDNERKSADERPVTGATSEVAQVQTTIDASAPHGPLATGQMTGAGDLEFTSNRTSEQQPILAQTSGIAGVNFRGGATIVQMPLISPAPQRRISCFNDITTVDKGSASTGQRQVAQETVSAPRRPLATGPITGAAGVEFTSSRTSQQPPHMQMTGLAGVNVDGGTSTMQMTGLAGVNIDGGTSTMQMPLNKSAPQRKRSNIQGITIVESGSTLAEQRPGAWEISEAAKSKAKEYSSAPQRPLTTSQMACASSIQSASNRTYQQPVHTQNIGLAGIDFAGGTSIMQMPLNASALQRRRSGIHDMTTAGSGSTSAGQSEGAWQISEAAEFQTKDYAAGPQRPLATGEMTCAGSSEYTSNRMYQQPVCVQKSGDAGRNFAGGTPAGQREGAWKISEAAQFQTKDSVSAPKRPLATGQMTCAGSTEYTSNRMYQEPVCAQKSGDAGRNFAGGTPAGQREGAWKISEAAQFQTKDSVSAPKRPLATGQMTCAGSTEYATNRMYQQPVHAQRTGIARADFAGGTPAGQREGAGKISEAAQFQTKDYASAPHRPVAIGQMTCAGSSGYTSNRLYQQSERVQSTGIAGVEFAGGSSAGQREGAWTISEAAQFQTKDYVSAPKRPLATGQMTCASSTEYTTNRMYEQPVHVQRTRIARVDYAGGTPAGQREGAGQISEAAQFQTKDYASAPQRPVAIGQMTCAGTAGYTSNRLYQQPERVQSTGIAGVDFAGGTSAGQREGARTISEAGQFQTKDYASATQRPLAIGKMTCARSTGCSSHRMYQQPVRLQSTSIVQRPLTLQPTEAATVAPIEFNESLIPSGGAGNSFCFPPAGLPDQRPLTSTFRMPVSHPDPTPMMDGITQTPYGVFIPYPPLNVAPATKPFPPPPDQKQ